MNKKELFAPFLVAALSLLFVAICFMVFISGGKSKKWISRKMWIGGLLLSLTSVTESACIHRSCYFYNPQIAKKIQREKSRESLKIKTIENQLITGHLVHSFHGWYSYKILNVKSKQLITKGSLSPVKGKMFQNSNEKFEIKLNEKLKQGAYLLKIYAEDSAFEEQNDEIMSMVIQI
jgi:hypothetical protein